MSFEEHLIQVMKDMRAALAKADVSDMRFDIEVSGRVHDGDLSIRFKLGKEYGQSMAMGDSIGAVTDEFLRRARWDARHDPLRLPAA